MVLIIIPKSLSFGYISLKKRISMNNTSRNLLPYRLFKSVCFTCTFILVIISLPKTTSAQLNLGLGASYGYAPTLKYHDLHAGAIYSGTGNVYSVFAELTLKNQFIGRLQYTGLLLNTLESSFSSFVKSSRVLTGSLGYVVLGAQEFRIQVPIMISSGAGFLDRGDYGLIPSLQLGFTVGPHFYITDYLAIFSEFQYLKGLSYSPGDDRISYTHITLGAKLRL